MVGRLKSLPTIRCPEEAKELGSKTVARCNLGF